MRRKISMQKLMIWPTIQLSVPNKQCLFQWAGKLPPWPSNTTSSITWWSPFHMQNRLIQKLLISIKPTSKNRKTSTHLMPSALCIGHKKFTCNLDIFLESCISSDVFAIYFKKSYMCSWFYCYLSMSYPQNIFTFLVFFLYGVIKMPLFTQPEIISCVKFGKCKVSKKLSNSS